MDGGVFWSAIGALGTCAAAFIAWLAYREARRGRHMDRPPVPTASLMSAAIQRAPLKAPPAPSAPITSAPDLAVAREAFLAEVERCCGGPARADYAAALDHLIRWTQEQGSALVFTPHSGPQKLVKFCVPGVETSFWSAWPRRADGAKLHVLTDPHPRFPESLREVARRELARLDGRQPKPGELPVVSFANLRSEAALRDVEAILSRSLAIVQGRT
jgi:hypothetical protein